MKSSKRAPAWALIAFLVSAPAGAVESAGLGIRPQGPGDWFRFQALPGEIVEETAVVQNKTNERVRLLLYAVDATITPQGGFALKERPEPKTGVGAWLSLDSGTLTVSPHSEERVPFRMTIPAGTEPGDYAGGIVIEKEPQQGTPQEVGKELAVQFNVVERMGVRIYLGVAGKAVRKLAAGALEWRRKGTDIEFRIGVRNQGNVQIVPEGTLRLTGRGAPGEALRMRGPEALFPSSRGTLTAVWRNPPSFALVTAVASVSYGGPAPVRAEASVRIVPWPAAAILLVVLVLAALGVFRGVRFWRKARVAIRAVEAGERTPARTP